MKPINLLPIAIATLSMSFASPEATLTDAERKYAITLLEDTKKALVQKVNGLTSEQLNFKPDADSWSIAECVEHIVIVESSLMEAQQTGLKSPADPSKRSEVKVKDEELVKMIEDRTTKRKTQESFKPSGKFGSFEATLLEFKTNRDKTILYVKATSEDLRNHYNDFPFGKIDTYQTILFAAAHGTRHTAQIADVMKNPGFPKKHK